MSAAVLVGGCSAGAASHKSPRVAAATRAHVDTAERHEAERRHDQARTAFEAALRSAPDAASRAFAAREYASTLISWGELGPAERQLETVTRLEPRDPSAWHDLGLLRHRRGDFAAARGAFEQSVARAPRDPRPRIALAAVLVNQGDYRAAAAQYRVLLELELPERTRAAVRRALKLLQQQLTADSAAGSAPRP